MVERAKSDGAFFADGGRVLTITRAWQRLGKRARTSVCGCRSHKMAGRIFPARYWLARDSSR